MYSCLTFQYWKDCGDLVEGSPILVLARAEQIPAWTQYRGGKEQTYLLSFLILKCIT